MKNMKRHTRLDSSGFVDKPIIPKYDSKCSGKISRKQRIEMTSSMNSEVNDDSMSSIMSNKNYLLENNDGMLKIPLKEVKSQFNNNQNSSSRRNQKPNKTLKSIMSKPSKGFRSEVGSNRNAEAPKTKLQKIRDEISQVKGEIKPGESNEKQEIRLNGLSRQLYAEMRAEADHAREKALKLYEESGWTRSSMFNNFIGTVVSYLGCGSRRRENSQTNAPIQSHAQIQKDRMASKTRYDEYLDLHYPRKNRRKIKLRMPDPAWRFSREDEDEEDVFE